MTKTWTTVVGVLVSAAGAMLLFAGCGSGTKNIDDDGGTVIEGGGGTQCTPNQVMCNNACTDTKKDHENCGACGTACKMGELCSAGTCATSCGGGTTQCGMICADTKVDPQNCGMCGTACKTGEVCSAGKCGNTCAMGQTICGLDGGAPYCANTKTDNSNCGTCGTTCAQGMVCSNGTCSTNCQMNETQCSQQDGGAPYCADVKNDNTNCGMCGKVCAAQETCVNGTCSSQCIQGQTLCTPDGGAPFCANLQTDNANCGTCGKTCTNGQSCQAGVCKTISCNLTALVLAGANANSNTGWSNVLKAANFTVTVVAGGAVSYANNPAATNFGVVVVSPDTNYGQDMAAAGQTGIINAQAGSTGVIFTEWAAYNVTSNVYQTLKNIMLFTRTSGITQAQTYTLTQNGHPIWQGLPNSFNTPVLGGNTGNTLINNGVQIASCSQCASIGVAVRDGPNARIVQIAHAAGYNLGGSNGDWYNDQNTAQMMANAALWAARCK